MSPIEKAAPRTNTCVYPQKIMLCIWWNSECMLNYELLSRGVTNTADIYCPQLRRLEDAIPEKRPTRLREMMLLHDNTHPNSANLTKTLYRGWFGKSFRTHLIYLILRPQIFTFSALYRTSFKELTFLMKMCSEHGLSTSTQNQAISTGAESKIYSSVSIDHTLCTNTGADDE